jgi:D-alanine-D-alanine ligase
MSMNILIAVAQDYTGRPDTMDAHRCARDVHEMLQGRGCSCEMLLIGAQHFERIDGTLENIVRRKPDCVINLFEGFGDDCEKEAAFARILEETGIPFTGNSSYTLGMCLDKLALKKALKNHGVPVPSGFAVKSWTDPVDISLRPPLFIKPRLEHGSVGIDRDSLVVDETRFIQVLHDKLSRFKKGLLIEEFIQGIEYSVGLLGNGPYELAGVSCLEYDKHGAPDFLTYEAKWNTLSSEYRIHVPRETPEKEHDVLEDVIRIAHEAGTAVRCRGYFRVDMRVRDGLCYVLDVNPNPDINKDSGFMKLMYRKNMGFYETLVKILGYCLSGSRACLQIAK